MDNKEPRSPNDRGFYLKHHPGAGSIGGIYINAR